ncbi:MAG: 4-hydroxybenzoyl-CoA reductase, partial [bacterium]|nr:4-hydroxybenzoyl-CoA reductase [bacterium]
MERQSLIGKRIPRIDGIPKVCGSALYTDDIKLPGMLYGKIVRSPIPHGRIINIDTSRVKRLRGVKAIVTGRDLGKGYGIYRIIGREELLDEYALAIDKV